MSSVIRDNRIDRFVGHALGPRGSESKPSHAAAGNTFLVNPTSAVLPTGRCCQLQSHSVLAWRSSHIWRRNLACYRQEIGCRGHLARRFHARYPDLMPTLPTLCGDSSADPSLSLACNTEGSIASSLDWKRKARTSSSTTLFGTRAADVLRMPPSRAVICCPARGPPRLVASETEEVSSSTCTHS